MDDPFDRKIGFVGIALVKGRIKNSFLTWKEIKPVLDTLLRNIGFTDVAPFLWVGLGYRYGIKNNLNVEFQRINKKHGDLPIAVELDMEILQWADRNNLDLLRDIYMIAALEALLQVGKKYDLPTDGITKERAKYGEIPNTIEECEKYKKAS